MYFNILFINFFVVLTVSAFHCPIYPFAVGYIFVTAVYLFLLSYFIFDIY